MAKTRVRIVGDRELVAKLRRLGGQQGQLLADALMIGALPFETRWKENIQSYPGRTHVGLIKTGTYLRSVHREVISVGRDRAAVMVGTNLTNPPYPWFLEMGTRRMAPKPHARPAWDSTRQEVEAQVRRALAFEVNRRVR